MNQPFLGQRGALCRERERNTRDNIDWDCKSQCRYMHIQNLGIIYSFFILGIFLILYANFSSYYKIANITHKYLYPQHSEREEWGVCEQGQGTHNIRTCTICICIHSVHIHHSIAKSGHIR